MLEDRHLAHDLALAQRGERHLAAPAALRDLHVSVDQGVERLAHAALRHEQLARLERHLLAGPSEIVQRLVAQALEQ